MQAGRLRSSRLAGLIMRCKCSYERRRNPKYLDLVLRAKLPHAVRRRVIGSSVVDTDRGTVDERTVDQPRSHHPSDVRIPADPRSATDISPERHVLRRLHRKTRVRVRDALRFSGRAGCVEDDERIFGGRGFGIGRRRIEVEKKVISLKHWCAHVLRNDRLANHEDILHARAPFSRCTRDREGIDKLSASREPSAGEKSSGTNRIHSTCDCIDTVSGENRNRDRSNPIDRQKRHNGLDYHWKMDTNRIALLKTAKSQTCCARFHLFE